MIKRKVNSFSFQVITIEIRQYRPWPNLGDLIFMARVIFDDLTDISNRPYDFFPPPPHPPATGSFSALPHLRK